MPIFTKKIGGAIVLKKVNYSIGKNVTLWILPGVIFLYIILSIMFQRKKCLKCDIVTFLERKSKLCLN